MNIQNQAVVSIHYTLTDENGEVLDSSSGDDPLTYLHGTGAIIPGLESELDGKESGDKLNVAVEPQEAYGEFDESLVQQVPREIFNEIPDLAPGLRLRTTEPDGPGKIITVVAIEDEAVTINANHPLAGMTLHFAVEVEDVREATDQEIEHGHVHD